MYTKELLDKIGYFKDVETDRLLDSLTGTISRGYILGLAKDLIKNKTPFTMAMLDLDNFKFINDNYGHIVGDELLVALTKDLIDTVGDKGLVGRYGGDEFIIIYFGDHTYEEAHAFAFSLYGPNKVVRKSYHLSTVKLFVTATVGNASYPRNAKKFDELFAMVDKTLYRGKTKGRNCYITYVKEKHEKIDVHKKEDNSLRVLFRTMNDIVKLNEKTDVLIKYLLNNLTSILGVTESIFVKTNGSSLSSAHPDEFETPEIYNTIIESTQLSLSEELFSPKNINVYKKNAEESVKNWIKDEKVLTFLVSEVSNTKEKEGNIILIEKNVQRIWQDRDNALVMYVDRLIEILLNA